MLHTPNYQQTGKLPHQDVGPGIRKQSEHL